jgi:hypothetical protein
MPPVANRPGGFWLYDASADELEAVVAEHERLYNERLSELRLLLGEPMQTDATHRSEVERWYPEIMRAACWDIQGKTLCLALEHQDREIPVIVLLRCLTADEVRELSA